MLAEDFAKVHWAWAPRTSELLSISLYSLQPGEHKCLVASVLQGSPGSAEGYEVAMCSCPVKSQSVGQVIRMSDMVALLSLIRKSNVNWLRIGSEQKVGWRSGGGCWKWGGHPHSPSAPSQLPQNVTCMNAKERNVLGAVYHLLIPWSQPRSFQATLSKEIPKAGVIGCAIPLWTVDKSKEKIIYWASSVIQTQCSMCGVHNNTVWKCQLQGEKVDEKVEP